MQHCRPGPGTRKLSGLGEKLQGDSLCSAASYSSSSSSSHGTPCHGGCHVVADLLWTSCAPMKDGVAWGTNPESTSRHSALCRR